MDIDIRQVTPEDTMALVHLSRKTFVDAFGSMNTPTDMAIYVRDNMNPICLKREIEDVNNIFYFITNNNKLCGYCKIRTSDPPLFLSKKRAIELERLYILEEYQNKKMGEKLLVHVLNYAKAQLYEFVWLGVWEYNFAAIRFYERHGFVRIGAHDFLLGNDLQTDLLFSVELSHWNSAQR